jgi:thiaminase/transcriptional activator TenA
VAISPCMRLYAYLGYQLARNNPSEHQFVDWICTYSSQEFEDLALQLEQLMDRYASDTPLAYDTQRYTMECEWNFFQAVVDSICPD